MSESRCITILRLEVVIVCSAVDILRVLVGLIRAPSTTHCDEGRKDDT